MSKKIITFEVDQTQMFETLRKVSGDTSALGARFGNVMLTGTASFHDALGLAVYGIAMTSVNDVATVGPIAEIAAERERQIEVEGWTAAHDDVHNEFEMAQAAAFYCLRTAADILPEPTSDFPSRRYEAFQAADCAWPAWWHLDWKKPKDARRNLVRAAALIVAEIERLDRMQQEAEGEQVDDTASG